MRMIGVPLRASKVQKLVCHGGHGNIYRPRFDTYVPFDTVIITRMPRFVVERRLSGMSALGDSPSWGACAEDVLCLQRLVPFHYFRILAPRSVRVD